MSYVEYIQIITPTPNGDIMERIDVGAEFWDRGICKSIHQRENGSFVCEFDKGEYIITDVKRYFIKK